MRTEVEFALSTISRRWVARQTDERRSQDRFRLTFELDLGEPDAREFASDHDRERFIAEGIKAQATSQDGIELLGCADPFRSLVGDPLEALTFVADYMHVVFQPDAGGFTVQLPAGS